MQLAPEAFLATHLEPTQYCELSQLESSEQGWPAEAEDATHFFVARSQ